MKLTYDQIPVEIDTTGLIEYASKTLKAMQKADPEFAECWTACCITFDDLSPEFSWGSIEDTSTEDGIYVEVPTTE